MFKKLRLNNFINFSSSFIKRNFTFKFIKTSPHLENLDNKINISEVNSKIKHIITNYKEKKGILDQDESFFIDNIKHYKIDKKTELALISEILAVTHNKRFHKVQNLNKNKISQNIKELQESDTSQIGIPKSSYDIFESFRRILMSKLKIEELKFYDFFELYKTLKNVKKIEPKFLFILSDSLELFLNKLIENNNTKKYNLKYLEKNLDNLKELSDIPYGKKLIGSFANFILKSEFKEKGNELKISDQLTEFLPTTFFGYDSEIFINFIVLNSNLKITPENEQNYFSTILYSLKELFFKSESKDKLNKLTPEQIKILDSKLSELIEGLYFKNKSNIDKVNVLFKQFLLIEKSNLSEIKNFSKLIQTSNKIINDYYEINNKNFREDFLVLRNLLNFYSKFYLEFKNYLFTNNIENKQIFEDYNKVMLRTYSMMKNYKINFNDYSENNSEFIFNIINLLYTNTMNHIENKKSQEFILNNFDKENIKKINDKTIPFQSLHKTMHKIILINTNLESKYKKETLDYSIQTFLDLYESKKTNLKEMNSYFINLNTILYNMLLDNYNNEEMIIQMIKKLFHVMKMFDFKEEKHIHKLILIIENLKLNQYSKISEKFHKEFLNLEKVYKRLPEITRPKFWWDKNNYFENKYEVKDIENILSKFGEVKVGPWIKNLYSCDFSIKNGDEEIFLEFISPYHIVNFDDLDRNLTLNKKYQRKSEIFKNNNLKLVYIPYEEILKDLNNITNYLK